MTKAKADLRWLYWGLAGLSLMLLGIYRGEVAIVLGKAVRICLECIGIG